MRSKALAVRLEHVNPGAAQLSPPLDDDPDERQRAPVCDRQRPEASMNSVTVIVPSYNHQAYVSECLHSILAQSDLPAKLVVIDDGSTDDSVPIIERELARCTCPAELIVHPVNRGLGATLNEAIARYVTTPLVTYLASDDRWLPGRIHTAALYLTAMPDAVASYGKCLLTDAAGHRLNEALFSTMEGMRLRPDRRVDLHGLLSFRTVPLAASVTYRSAAVEDVGGWREHTETEDYEMYLRLARVGEFVWTPGTHAVWRLHSGQVSKSLDRMLSVALEVQRRVMCEFGVPDLQQQHYQSCIRYAYGEHFLRAGDFRTGAHLTLQNLDGAPRSAEALLERAARLILTAARR